MSPASVAVPDPAPEVYVRNLLRDEWDKTNTLGYDHGTGMRIHHGWLDPNFNLPEVTVTPGDETTIGGGDTGYSGITPENGHPSQDRQGTIQVNCWANRDRTDDNPRQLVYLFAREVENIVRDNFGAPGSDYWFISPGTNQPLPDPDRETVMFRRLVPVVYGWHRRFSS